MAAVAAVAAMYAFVCPWLCPVPILAIGLWRLWKSHARQVAGLTGARFREGKAARQCRRVAVIGAGAGGLTASYFLDRKGVEPVVLEATHEIGGVWSRPLYQSLRANVVAAEMTLPGLDYPEGTGLYPSKDEVLAYLRTYCDKFALSKFIRFGCRATHVSREGAKWNVQWTNERGENENDTFDGLVVATGQTGEPYYPAATYKGFSLFGGSSIHAASFRDPEPYLGKRVLVVGVGSASGVDIAQQISCCAAKTHVSIGRPRMIVKPGDGLMGIGFDRRLDLYFIWLRKYFIEGHAYMFVEWLRYGSRENFTKSTGIIRPDVVTTNPLNVSTDPYDFVRRCYTGAITVQRGIESFDGNSVRFVDGRRAVVDSIVWATGYVRNFACDPMLKSLLPVGDSSGRIKLFEYMFLPSGEANVAFVCEQHPLGPHWRVIAAQTELLTRVFLGELELPSADVTQRDAKWIDPRQRDTSEDAVGEALRYHAMMGRRYPTAWEVLGMLLKRPRETWRLLLRPMHELWLVEAQ